MGLPRTVSEINGEFSRKLQIFPTPYILRSRWRGSPWNLVSAHGQWKLEWRSYQIVKKSFEIGLAVHTKHIYISSILINGIRIMHQSFEMKGFVNQEEIKQLQRERQCEGSTLTKSTILYTHVSIIFLLRRPIRVRLIFVNSLHVVQLFAQSNFLYDQWLPLMSIDQERNKTRTKVENSVRCINS